MCDRLFCKAAYLFCFSKTKEGRWGYRLRGKNFSTSSVTFNSQGTEGLPLLILRVTNSESVHMLRMKSDLISGGTFCLKASENKPAEVPSECHF